MYEPDATTLERGNISRVNGINHCVVALVDQTAGFSEGHDLFNFVVVLFVGFVRHDLDR